jgi:hypothetical protein
MQDQATYLLMQARKKGFDPVYALIAVDTHHELRIGDDAEQYEKDRQRWRDILTA